MAKLDESLTNMVDLSGFGRRAPRTHHLREGYGVSESAACQAGVPCGVHGSGRCTREGERRVAQNVNHKRSILHVLTWLYILNLPYNHTLKEKQRVWSHVACYTPPKVSSRNLSFGMIHQGNDAIYGPTLPPRRGGARVLCMGGGCNAVPYIYI